MTLHPRRLAAVCLSHLASICVYGQTTDVAEKVSTALTKYGPVPVTRVIQVPRKVTHCRTDRGGGGGCWDVTVYDARPQTTSELLTATNIRIVKSAPLSWGTKIKHDLPDHLTVDDFLAKNCTPSPASPAFSLSTSFQRTASVALSQSVTHTLTYGLSVSVKLSDVFTVGGNVTLGESETSGVVSTTGSSSTVTQTRSGTQAVPSNTFLMIELRTWPVQYTVPFDTTVIVDADLSANDRGIHQLSDILSEPMRTFPISGKIEAQDASSGDLVFYDLPFDPKECPVGATSVTVVKGYIPSPTTHLQPRK